ICHEYPSTVREIKYQGAKHLSEDELNSVTGLRKGGVLNPTANWLACQAIQNKYSQMGRPFSEVKLIEGSKPEDSRVVFNITEGPEVKVKSISFVVCKFEPSPVLKTHINSSSAFLGLLGGKYNDAMVEDDIRRIKEYYHSFGFHDVKVSRELRWADDSSSVNLIFHISEGIRYQIKDHPQVYVNKSTHPSAELTAKTKTSPGKN